MSVPALGFGGASMGSRKSAGESLAALHRAHEAGIDWFDVAPSYGDGEAERVLGRFLRESGGKARVCTKVGILPGKVSLPKRLLRPVLRTALNVAPGLRGAIKRNRPPAAKLPLTAAMIAASIDESLTRLGLAQVDVLALHDATPLEVTQEPILRALEAVLASGKAARVGIASSCEAACAGLAASPLFGFVQVANNPFAPGAAEVARLATGRALLATHSVFGASGMAAAIAARIEASEVVRELMRAGGYSGTPLAMASRYLPDFALTASGVDVVVMSMFARAHLDANLASRTRAMALDRVAIAAIAVQLAQP